MFHCSVINVLLLIFVISSPEQLWYHIMLFAVCQELFSTFYFSFFDLNNTEKEGFEPSRRFNTTYTLSRGASSASWVFLLNYFKPIFCLRLTAHFLLYSCILQLSSCFLYFFTCFIRRLMICHNRILLCSLSGVACTTPDTSKKRDTLRHPSDLFS